MFEVLLTGLEGILTELHADLGGGIVHEISVGAKDISVISSRRALLLVWVPVCALLLWLR